MGHHAAPGRDQAVAQQLGADEGAHDSHAPHADDVDDEGNSCSAHALHHALDDDGHTVDGLRHRHHPQHRGTKGNDLSFVRENIHQGRCRQEQGPAGEDHQQKFDGNEHPGQVFHPPIVPGTVGIACQSRRGGLHAVAGNVESRFHRIGDGMGSGCHLAQTVDHGSEGHIAKGGSEPLEHIGESHLQTGSQDLHVGQDALSSGRYQGMPPQHCGNADASQGKCCGTGRCRTQNAPIGAPDDEFMTEQDNLPGGIDQQEIQNHIHQIHRHTDLHGRLGVTGGAEDRAENNAGRPGQHGHVENEEILGGLCADLTIHPHPHRNHTAERQGQGREENTHHQNRQHRLGNRALGLFPVPFAEGFGNVGQKADAQGGDGAVDQPVDGGSRTYGGGGAGAQASHHGGVDVLDRRLHQLLQHGGPRQTQDDGNHGGIQFVVSVFHVPPSGYLMIQLYQKENGK